MIWRLVYLTCFVLFSFCGKAQTVSAKEVLYCTDEDRAVFDRFMEEMKPKQTLPTGDLMVETARFFLGVPYVAATLEQVPEGLVVNFRGLDCMTLVENTIALVNVLQTQSAAFEDFCHILSLFRYNNACFTGSSFRPDYTDRLHYTADWIYENRKRGKVKDVTQEIGGKPLALNVSFMSTHPDSYKQLKDSPERIARMEAREKVINARTYFYVPQEEIEKYASGIKNGDIVCFVTNIKGLDISHVGVACRTAEKLTFIHASSVAKKVIVNEESLAEYTKRIKSNTGIMVIRPL